MTRAQIGITTAAVLVALLVAALVDEVDDAHHEAQTHCQSLGGKLLEQPGSLRCVRIVETRRQR